MKAERMTPIALSKEQGKELAMKVAEKRLNKKVYGAKYLGGGSFGRVYCVDFFDHSKIVVKFLLTNGMVEKEVHDLKLLAAHCPIKIPKVFFMEKADGFVDCYGMERMEGRPAFFQFGMLFAKKRKKQAFADRVVESLHAIHACKNEKFGDTMDPTFDTWQECYKPFAKEIYDDAEKFYSQKKLSKKIISAMRLAWEKFDIIFSEKVEEACLIHGDLNVVNIMVDKRGELTAFIDPLNSMYADKEYDLFQFYNLTGKKLWLGKTYVEKYGASKYYKQKIAFYGLWNEVLCAMKSNTIIPFIMNPLVKNMNKAIAELRFDKVSFDANCA